MQIIWVTTVLFCVGTAAIADPTASVRCVQQQLHAAGEDVGQPDGKVGAKTLSSLAKFEAQTELDTTLPFRSASASSYCRRIGLAHAQLREFWPSARSPVNVLAAGDVPEVLRLAVQNRMRAALIGAARRMEVELAGTDTVLIATSPTALRQLITANSDYDVVGLAATLEKSCKSDRKFIASTVSSLVYICVDSGATIGDGIEADWLAFSLTHEATHLVQFQVNGVSDEDATMNDMVKHEGPVWLQEGLGQVFANVTTMGGDEAFYREVMISRFEGSPLPDLATLEKRNALSTDMSHVYWAGSIAVADLVEVHGYPAFGRFFASLGNGESWEDAFKSEFGQAVPDFYADFRNRPR